MPTTPRLTPPRPPTHDLPRNHFLHAAEGRAAARLSRQLVQIETNLDLPPVLQPLEELRCAGAACTWLTAL